MAVEGLGTIAQALARRGVERSVSRIDMGEAVPARLMEDALVVMGGPMGLCDVARLPHLQAELALIGAALEDGRPVLGICLGSQLLAAALGASVRAGPSQEIGWGTVELTDAGRRDPVVGAAPPRFEALHWHGDVFDLPSGSLALARSAVTQNQAFGYGGNAYGLLFHLEAGIESVRAMGEAFGDELDAAGVSRSQLLGDTAREAPRAGGIGLAVFDRWIALWA